MQLRLQASARTLFADLKTRLEPQTRGPEPSGSGSVDDGLAHAAVKIEAQYRIA